MHAQLAHDIGAVRFGCPNADIEKMSNSLATLALRNQLNDFPFT